MKVWKVSSASQWWRPASIIPIRRARRNQRKAYSQNSPAGCATTAVAPLTRAVHRSPTRTASACPPRRWSLRYEKLLQLRIDEVDIFRIGVGPPGEVAPDRGNGDKIGVRHMCHLELAIL